MIYWFVNMGREAGKLSTLAGQLDYYVPIWWNKLAAWGYGPDKLTRGWVIFIKLTMTETYGNRAI